MQATRLPALHQARFESTTSAPSLKVLGNSGHPNKARLSHTHNWECASQHARVVTILDPSWAGLLGSHDYLIKVCLH